MIDKTKPGRWISVFSLHSLFRKFLAVSLLCMVVPILVSLFYALSTSSKALQSQVQDKLTSMVQEKTNFIEATLDAQAALVVSMMREPYLVDYLEDYNQGQKDPAKLARITENFTKMFDQAQGFYENVFLMVGSEVIADGMGGKSLGFVAPPEEAAAAEGGETSEAPPAEAGQAGEAAPAGGEDGAQNAGQVPGTLLFGEDLVMVTAGTMSPITGRPGSTVMG